ncbi:preprotein translocase subunit SecG [Streptomyces sp. HB132]|nr:preprotein translocase subunit SecG [Streptomyces sp. HB132]
MPRAVWSTEQRASVKRYLQFAAFFAVLGIIFSAFLIISGNTGGWALLGIIVCIAMVGLFFIQKGRGGQA